MTMNMGGQLVQMILILFKKHFYHLYVFAGTSIFILYRESAPRNLEGGRSNNSGSRRRAFVHIG